MEHLGVLGNWENLSFLSDKKTQMGRSLINLGISRGFTGNYGKSPCLMGELTFDWAIFKSKP